MSLKRMFLVAQKTIREIIRSLTLLFFLLGLPIFFMATTYIGYGHTPKTATYRVLLLSNTDKAQELIKLLQEASYADGRPCFQFDPVSDRAEAESRLKNKEAVLLFILEEDVNGQIWYTSRGDAMNMQFIKASAQLEAIVIPWLERQQGHPERFALESIPLEQPRPLSEFEAYVPGMMIFAILLIIPQTAMLMGQEHRRGSLKRLNLSLLRPVEFLSGLCLAQMLVALVQVGLMLITALALGFHNRGSIVLTVFIGCLVAFGSVGLGLLLGCFMKNDTDALNTGSAVSMFQVILSGSFFAMPSTVIGHWMSHPIAILDFLPATNGMIALQRVLSGGATLDEVGFRVAATGIMSLLFFIIGVMVYRRFGSI